MSSRPFRLGRSLTGLGLFATKPIKKASRIAEYRGRRLGIDAALKAEKSGNRYLYEVNSKITIDGAKHGNIARYFNHSCNPNCDTFIRNKRVFIRTLRNIKPEEELTYDYGRDYLKNVIGLENCQCSRCRKRRTKVAAAKREANKRRKARLARLAGKVTGKNTAKTAAKKKTKAVTKAKAAKKTKSKTKARTARGKTPKRASAR
ncbi:MAG: SET domain-containing protein [Pseudolabrys sp.]|nr:SET domain-containing protein [Pseudolabrys sp.]